MGTPFSKYNCSDIRKAAWRDTDESGRDLCDLKRAAHEGIEQIRARAANVPAVTLPSKTVCSFAQPKDAR
jgi:hypothetical protein